MFPHEREAKIKLRKKRRTPTPDEQDLEINRESKKTVSFGEDLVGQFETNLKSGNVNAKVESGIKVVVLETQKRRAEDVKKRKAYVEMKTKGHAEDNSELQQLPE